MAENMTIDEVNLKPKDFSSSQDVRWCPGCGDYSILAQMQRVSPEFGVKKENFVWVSGIGCASRFPYYMDTFGLHSIHGRAPTIATGIKVQNPELSVWVATGDGDTLSIGGNHFIHACRRNIGIKIILFNNRIYGLTKGQYSPTSEKGKVTNSSPYGSIDYPFEPTALAIGAGATFVARTIDREPKHLKEMIRHANSHAGTVFLEVYQNCNIFNDGTFFALTDKETKFDKVLNLEHDKPMVFGKENNKGIILDGFTPRVVDLTNGKYSLDDLWIHDERDLHASRAYILTQFAEFENLPTPIGVFRRIDKPTYEQDLHQQINDVIEKEGEGNLKDLLFSGNTWEVN